MKKGDKVLFYHSVTGKEVVGIAKVSKEGFADPTDEKWTAVEIMPDKKLKKPVSLADIKANVALANFKLIRQSQLSVLPVTKDEFEEIVEHVEVVDPIMLKEAVAHYHALLEDAEIAGESLKILNESLETNKLIFGGRR